MWNLVWCNPARPCLGPHGHEEDLESGLSWLAREAQGQKDRCDGDSPQFARHTVNLSPMQMKPGCAGLRSYPDSGFCAGSRGAARGRHPYLPFVVMAARVMPVNA